MVKSAEAWARSRIRWLFGSCALLRMLRVAQTATLTVGGNSIRCDAIPIVSSAVTWTSVKFPVRSCWPPIEHGVTEICRPRIFHGTPYSLGCGWAGRAVSDAWVPRPGLWSVQTETRYSTAETRPLDVLRVLRMPIAVVLKTSRPAGTAPDPTSGGQRLFRFAAVSRGRHMIASQVVPNGVRAVVRALARDPTRRSHRSQQIAGGMGLRRRYAAGTTALDGLDGAPAPALLEAVTVKV